MDWPLVGAVAGVTCLAGVVAFGSVAVLTSETERTTKSSSAPVLLVERPSEFTLNARPQGSLTVTSGRQTLASAVPTLTNPPPTYRPQYTSPPIPRNETDARPTPAPERKKVALHHPTESAKSHTKPHPERRSEAPEKKLKVVDPRFASVLTSTKIARIKRLLRLTAEQSPHWGVVEAELRMIGRRQLSQIREGQKVEVDTSSVQSLYMAARPLLDILRPDQKEQIRELARSLGYASVASMI